mgnify:CR=1 FL=1
MDGKVAALALFGTLFLSSLTVLVLSGDDDASNSEEDVPHFHAGDPLFQGEGHDHMNASQHVAGTCLLYTSPSPRD